LVTVISLNYFFDDFIEIIENLGFGDFFRQYRRRDGPEIDTGNFITSIGMPSFV